MPTRTTRLALPAPTGGEPADGPDGIADLATALDAVVLGYGQGVLSSRPTAGVEGRMYYATDDGALYYDTGVGWVPAAAQPGDVRLTASSRSSFTGWLPCDGAAVSRRTYAALFAELGTAHGAGDGSTTFNLIDLRGRAPIGSGTGSGLTARALGARVGTETHRLTVTEMPAHTHDTRLPIRSGSPAFSYALGTDTGNQQLDWPSRSTGGDGAHNNMQPSLVLNAWIKV